MLLLPLLWALFASTALAAFGYTDHGTYWTIDNGANLVVQVSRTNGDIQSMKYKVSVTHEQPYPGSQVIRDYDADQCFHEI